MWWQTRTALRLEVALLRQQRDWLVAQVNRLETDHALLLHRLTGVALPVPEVVAPRVGGVAGTTVHATPLAPANLEAVAGIDIGALMIGQAAFEDMGDDAAAREGIPTEVVVQLP